MVAMMKKLNTETVDSVIACCTHEWLRDGDWWTSIDEELDMSEYGVDIHVLSIENNDTMFEVSVYRLTDVMDHGYKEIAEYDPVLHYTIDTKEEKWQTIMATQEQAHLK